MSDEPKNEVALTEADQRALIAETVNLPLALRVMLNPVLLQQVGQAARVMADGGAFIPKHLAGKPRACFAVIVRSWDWKLDPYWVAQCTYETPGGQVGFEGKLCQAILENSGHFAGGIRFEHYGDWSKLVGRFKIVKNARGNDVPVCDWPDEEERGLGVEVIGQVKGEEEPRRWKVDLVQAYPRNSPLWVTDPRTQICYLAVRRFGDVAAPGIYGGVRFNVDEFIEASDRAVDVTPPLQTAEQPITDNRRVVDAEEDPATDKWVAVDFDHNEHEFETVESFIEAVKTILKHAAGIGKPALDAAWEANTAELQRAGTAVIQAVNSVAIDLAAEITQREKAATAQQPEQAANDHDARSSGDLPTPATGLTDLRTVGDAIAKQGVVPLNGWWDALTPRMRGDLGARGRGRGDQYAAWLVIAEEADRANARPSPVAPVERDAAATSTEPSPTPSDTGEDDSGYEVEAGDTVSSDTQMVVSAEVEGPVQRPTPAPPPHTSDPFWSGMLDVPVPRRPNGSPNWPEFARDIARRAGEAPTREKLLALRGANNRRLSDLKLGFYAGFQEFENAETTRAGSLG